MTSNNRPSAHLEKIKKVMFIDQATAFGGSFVVLSTIVNNLDENVYHPFVIGEMEYEQMASYFNRKIFLRRVRHLMNYQMVGKIKSRLFMHKGKWYVKSINYLIFAARLLANSGYMIRLAIEMIYHRVDILHINNSTDNFEAICVGKILNIPLVIHVHGSPDIGAMSKIGIGSDTIFIAISEYIKEELIRAGVKNDQIRTIKNSVSKIPENISETSFDRSIKIDYRLPSNAILIGIVGRVVEWKGQLEFIESLKIAVQTNNNIIGVIIGDISDGDAEYLEILQKLVNDYNLNDHVIFTGYERDLDYIYPELDVVVHASIEAEPFGLVVVEAMAYGKPVVVSNLGAPKEIVRNNVTGFIINPIDSVAMAEAIVRLAKDSKLRNTMGNQGRRDVVEHFNPDVYIKSIENVYLQIS